MNRPEHQEEATGLLVSSKKMPFLLQFRSSKQFILTVVAIAVFTDTFFYTLIIPILPNTLEERAGISRNDAQQWVSIMLSTYALMNLLISPLAGILTDRSATRRAPLLIGLIAMAASTTLYTFGRTIALLVVARALQGASAAIIRVGGLALITDTFGADQAGAAMGWQSVGMFVGTVTGPCLSGILYDNFGHYAVFIAAYVVLGTDILLRLVMIETKVAARWQSCRDEQPYDRPLKSRPSTKAALSEPLLTERFDSIPGSHCSTTDMGNSSLVPLPRFSILSLLLNRRLIMALWATFVCALIMTALESVVPLYTMRLFSWKPTQTGMLLIALAVSIVADPLLGAWTDKHGSRWFSVAGQTVTSIVYAASITITHDTTGDRILLCILLVILGFAIGSVSTPNMVEISLFVHAEEKKKPGTIRTAEIMGQAYAMLNVSYGLGSLVGPAWGAILMITTGWVVLSTSFAILAALSAILMLIFAGERRGTPQVDNATFV